MHSGGCTIGERPIDLHLYALQKLGAEITVGEVIHAKAPKLKGCEIVFPFPSVGATENAMLAAVLAEGTTIIRNCAREPEIEDLQGYLNSCGAKVRGAGSSDIIIEGVKSLHSCDEYSIMPDRIEAGTFLIAGAATYGKVLVRNIIPTHIYSLIEVLYGIGCRIEITNDSVYVESARRLLNTNGGINVKTLPYPGFPTDLQAPLTSLFCIASGSSVIEETIFENRFKHVPELIKMGADIEYLNDNSILINGVDHLHGGDLISSDLRCGAALIIGGLAAEGNTYIDDEHYIERGYADIEKKFQSLGGDIKTVKLCATRIV